MSDTATTSSTTTSSTTTTDTDAPADYLSTLDWLTVSDVFDDLTDAEEEDIYQQFGGDPHSLRMTRAFRAAAFILKRRAGMKGTEALAYARTTPHRELVELFGGGEDAKPGTPAGNGESEPSSEPTSSQSSASRPASSRQKRGA